LIPNWLHDKEKKMASRKMGDIMWAAQGAQSVSASVLLVVSKSAQSQPLRLKGIKEGLNN